MRWTWAALAGLVGACAICCAPLIIAGLGAAAAVLAGWGVGPVAAGAVAILALVAAGVVVLRGRRKTCGCRTACDVSECGR